MLDCMFFFFSGNLGTNCSFLGYSIVSTCNHFWVYITSTICIMLYWLHLIWQWCGSLSTLCHLEGVCWMVHALPCPSFETDKPCWGSVCSKMRARTTSTVSVFNQWSKMPMIRLVCLLPLYLLVGFRHGVPTTQSPQSFPRNSAQQFIP